MLTVVKLMRKRSSILLACAITSASFSAVAADTDSQNLEAIKNNTSILSTINTSMTSLLAKVDGLRDQMTTIATMAASWMHPDDSDSTAAAQSQFNKLGGLLIKEPVREPSEIQGKLNQDLFPDVSNLSGTLPYANDLAYSTLLGQPIFDKDPRNNPVPAGKTAEDPLFNYIKIASGLSAHHELPPLQGGAANNIREYSDYFKTVKAVNSYGAYVLSREYKQDPQLTETQKSLITQASSSDWFLNTAANASLGQLLRQLLMYQSQSFVLLAHYLPTMLETQREIANAQIMTNTLLIQNNRSVESYLLSRAQGVSMTP